MSKLIVSIILALLITLPGKSGAVCHNSFLNPITDVCWQCMFPIKVGGLTVISSVLADVDEPTGGPICNCGVKFGLLASYWQPTMNVETVKDPYCFPTFGLNLGNPKDGYLGGGTSTRHGAPSSRSSKSPEIFQQAHYLIFAPLALLDLFMDMPCLDKRGIDIAYITELDPLWQDSMLSEIINPEADLFGNWPVQLACMADSAAANLGMPLDALFWCMGSWGSAYPLDGHVAAENYVQGNASVQARLLYKLQRELISWDLAMNYCSPQAMPIWIKSHYRTHIMKPVRDFTCHPIGRSGLLWAYAKNPPFSAGNNASDNMAWMSFKKTRCCIFFNNLIM